MNKKTRYIVHCLICGNETFAYPKYPKKYCSIQCLYKGRKNNIFTAEHRRKISESVKNNLPSTAYKKGNVPANANKPGPKGDKASHWKGGITKDSKGYILIHNPQHIRANKQGYVRQTFINMEIKIGRPVTREEVVHHINRIITDDSPENLQLFANNSEHIKHHWKERKNIH